MPATLAPPPTAATTAATTDPQHGPQHGPEHDRVGEPGDERERSDARQPQPGPPDPLADTVRPTDEDLAVTRKLSTSGAKRFEPRPDDPPGYRLRKLLGRGAFGSVWLAREAATGKRVAVKVFRHVRALDWALLTREAEKLAALDASRHVVRLLAVGWDADPPYYVMEYLPEGALSEKLAADGPLPPAEAERLADGIAAGLVHAHGSGVLHCDLKPGNVLLDADGTPRLCDFGQARGFGEPGGAAAGGSGGESHSPALGTLFYMPPEQTRPGAAPDARWDVYALGAVFHEMLTGRPPHRRDETAARLSAAGPLEARLAEYRRVVEDGEPPREHRSVRGVDRPLADVVSRCLAVNPADRFPNAQAVRAALADRREHAARGKRVRWAVLGPAALAAALAPVAVTVADRAVDTAEEEVLDRALDTNAVSAGVVALSLERELELKREELERLADHDSLRTQIDNVIADGWEPGPAREKLGAFLAGHTTVQSGDDRESEDTSWFLTDAAGRQRWRDPASPGTLDAPFHWRDYYHGRGVELPRDTPLTDVSPVSETYVSHPFRSDATGRMMVSLSTPVRNDRGETVALLARTLHLNALLAEYNVFRPGIEGGAAAGGPADAPEPRDEPVTRVIALYERRSGELLDHPWLDAHPHATAAEKAAARLPEGERAVLEQLAALAPRTIPAADGRAAVPAVYRSATHADPVAGVEGGGRYDGAWIAAFVPVGGTDWATVVQERRAAALAPIESFRVWLVRIGLGVLLAIVLLLTAVWLFLTRAPSRGAPAAGVGPR